MKCTQWTEDHYEVEDGTWIDNGVQGIRKLLEILCRSAHGDRGGPGSYHRDEGGG